MSKQFEKLVGLLKELFQLDQPDLDFGLYRIMHAKADEISQFLDKDLLPQVQEAFSQYQTADKVELEKELKELVAGIEKAGMDPDESPKVKELKQRIADDSVDVGALENEVYDHLFSFFRRYYHQGDFLAKRVYKPGVYAIPYEGEEITLHWANRDQYYIKTSEYLRDYAFTLKPGDDKNPMRAHFRLVKASEGEHGNVKDANGNERVFILANDDFIAVEDGELILHFHYRPATMNDWSENGLAEATEAARKKPPVQKVLLADAINQVLSVGDASLKTWIAELSKRHVKMDGETADYSRLEGHLNRYTKRHTFDYFIHKNLGAFLRRELDFFIKNEIMHLDDVEDEGVARVEQYLSKIKVVRQIAAKIIDFLAQLEDFQIKLWEKKKFVSATSYCISLDKIPEAFYSDISSNEEQISEWINLLSIDELHGYKNPLSLHFLKDNNSLLVDTRFFPTDWVERLIAQLNPQDFQESHLLVHGENFQGLSLLHSKYRGSIRTMYIDPPYNTGQDGFVYKDSYKDSSWTTMMYDRLALARPLLEDKGTIFCSINEIERFNLEAILNEVFGKRNRVEELIWARDTVSNNSPAYSTNHEYIEVYARNRTVTDNDRAMFREQRDGYKEVYEVIDRIKPGWPDISEIEKEIRQLYKDHASEHVATAISEGLTKQEAKKSDPWKGLYPYKFAEYRDDDGRYVEESNAKQLKATIWVFREVEPSMPSGKQSATIHDPESDNYRFYCPEDPELGVLGKAPKRGWAFPEKSLPGRPSFEAYREDIRLVFKGAENIPQLKYFLHEVESVVSTSVFRQYADGEPKLEALFGEKGLIDNPKPPALIERIIRQTTDKDSSIVDFFAGSGTTGQAVIDANRNDGGARKFILLEVGDYFNTVLLPRIKKSLHASNWRDGKPVTRDGVGGIIKCIHLESYEDSVNNINIKRTSNQDSLLEKATHGANNDLRQEYILRYMLGVESRGSQSLLNVEKFGDPTSYKLKIKQPNGDESREINIDLPETFSYLIGLTVNHIAAPQTFNAALKPDEEGRLRLDGRLKQDEAGPWWFRTVDGVTPDGRKTLIIWRKFTGDSQRDNLVLDEWFTRSGYSTQDYEFDLIYVNGDNNLENLRQPDETWKVRLIEEDFHRLMFDVENV